MLICIRCGWVQSDVPAPQDPLLVVHECPLCPTHTREYIQAIADEEQNAYPASIPLEPDDL